MKYVLVSGGVISGIGKGVIASSTGLLLKTLGLKVTSIKIDPYMNIDAGTMSPLEHGEVFVLNDGGEVDLDLGNYERYLNVTLTKDNNITTGKVYSKVIEKERRGDYLGKTVQIVPHVTNEIQDWVERVARVPVDQSGEEPDVCIVELGGTVGDIESAAFVEAMRQFQFRVGRDNFVSIHVSLVPVINGEQKTKPTQQAIRDLRSLGIMPDLIACRCKLPLEENVIEKISLFCHVGPEQVLAVHDVSSTYHVPQLLENKLLDFLKIRFKSDQIPISSVNADAGSVMWNSWKLLTSGHDRLFQKVSIVLVGKYTHLKDSYISVIKALEHSAMRCGRKLDLQWVEASHLEASMNHTDPLSYHKAWHLVCSANGILVPGGFGSRGIEGMIAAAQWARENNTPYLGICLGLQVAVIEFARHVCEIEHATSEEFDPQADKHVIVYMPEINKDKLGGTMRLGLRPTIFQPNSEWSKLRKLHKNSEEVLERHRHRYEVNPKYVELMEERGLTFVGKDEKAERMEIIEKRDHPYFVGVQYHPEYLSKPLKPSTPIFGLVAASAGLLDQFISSGESVEWSDVSHFNADSALADSSESVEVTSQATIVSTD
ncbi:CTP synthase Cts1 [Schizosaccharomyces cryophilus OY26]|uniref:CTP synthase n=1 Tax=Schizosaccharomyces cryophilus (strain OY26 / ATCC MYA-4695 / CBS 11777 / NBRC 106824 / NRRL Y48691) TaxID=653667 RepID=S9VXG1_SCHCR|nr:CTP synthase Cts1 [Schizosaccharomyces cryophilus OY26]EPY50859.1 CTP synthase Cts1 [Schizosaccharomyces cryophilus OY26]